MSEEKATYCALTIPMLVKQFKSKARFLMWAKKFKGMAVAKVLSSEMTGIRDIPNKYEGPDDIKSTTDAEKAAVTATKKNSLAIEYLYRALDTSKGAGCLTKTCSDDFPLGIAHKAWVFLHERLSKSYVTSVSELREKV